MLHHSLSEVSQFGVTRVGKDVEKLEPLHMAGGHVKWGSHFGKIWQVLKTLNIVAI